MNKIKSLLVSSLICLSLFSFAQNSKYTPIQEGEYLVKILMHEMTLDNEKIVQIREAVYTAATEKQKIADAVGTRKDDSIMEEIKKLNNERDAVVRDILSEEEFDYYTEILDDFYAKIFELEKNKK